MTQLRAQPYDISATGFFFQNADEYRSKADKNRNDHDEPVEEYEIQFIDGDEIDCALAKTWGVSQANLAAYLEAAGDWDDEQKTRYIIAVGECGYCHEQAADNPDQIDIQLYEVGSMRELAEQFVDDGLFGDIPERLENYLDYDAVARDLAVDYSEVTIAGTNFVFYCA